MKFILILSILLPINYYFALSSFASNHLKRCVMNKENGALEKCIENDESSLFEMNEKETMITHTTSEGIIIYYIKSKEFQIVKDVKTWTYVVVNENGNQYICIFQPEKKLIKFLIFGNDETGLIFYYVKSMF